MNLLTKRIRHEVLNGLYRRSTTFLDTIDMLQYIKLRGD